MNFCVSECENVPEEDKLKALYAGNGAKRTFIS